MKIILASQSPRRREILDKIGIEYDVKPAHCNEITNLTEPSEIVVELAKRKANAVEGNIILGADTIVAKDNVIFGKPKDKEDAFRMLKSLQDSWHTVYTGVCINNEAYFEKTDVHMVKLSDKEIKDYIATGEPMDKAGAYAIQGIGGKFIDQIEGEFETVMGLPIKRLQGIIDEYTNKQ